MHEDIQIHIRPDQLERALYILHIRYKKMIYKGRIAHGMDIKMDIKCIIQIKYV